MSKLVENILEILLSLCIVVGLLYVAFYVKPTVTVPAYSPTLFGHRDHYYSIVSPRKEQQVIWAAGNNGRVIRSDNAGKDWRIQDTGTKRNLQSLAPWDANSAIAIGDLATVLITDDAGKSWTEVPVEVYEYGDQLLQVCIDPERDQAWISGTMATVMKSSDHGHSWRMVHPKEDLAWNDITVAPDGSVWVVGEFGRMQRSLDDGASWQEITVPAEGSSLMAIAFSGHQQGMAVGLSGLIIRSGDGGKTWSRVDDVSKAHFFDVAWNGHGFVAVGNNGVLAHFTPDGVVEDVARVSANNSGWYTQLTPLSDDDYLIAGIDVGRRTGGKWNVYQ